LNHRIDEEVSFNKNTVGCEFINSFCFLSPPQEKDGNNIPVNKSAERIIFKFIFILLL